MTRHELSDGWMKAERTFNPIWIYAKLGVCNVLICWRVTSGLRSLPCQFATHRTWIWFPQELERVYAPHVNVQVVDVAEIRDQVPSIMSMEDSRESSPLPIDPISTQDRMQDIKYTNRVIILKFEKDSKLLRTVKPLRILWAPWGLCDRFCRELALWRDVREPEFVTWRTSIWTARIGGKSTASKGVFLHSPLNHRHAKKTMVDQVTKESARKKRIRTQR